ARSAVKRRAAESCTGPHVGWACSRQAATPATVGVENEVPLAVVYPCGFPVGSTTAQPTPRATTSGLMRPSLVGPREEKLAIVPSDQTAPTVSALSPSTSPGATM